MSAIAEPVRQSQRSTPRAHRECAATLARRRAALTASNPRQILVPLLGPALLALVVAPALKSRPAGCTRISTMSRSSASAPLVWSSR